MGYGYGMAPSSRKAAELFLPPRGGSRARRSAAVEDNPAFQALWDRVSAIPRGQVSTYGAVARAAGLPGRARLTGLALRVAPRGMHLPWHRVVGAGGRIVFPKTSAHYREQAKRLRAEGVAISNGRVGRAFLLVED
jgi:methylated-DNA-protein-cysteine methyltransferase related protein